MAFKDNFRMERVYFEKLKSDIDIMRSYIAAGAVDEAKAVLENAVDVDGAVLLLYRNVGEAWAELADAITQTKKDLEALKEKTEAYHDELNEKIDEVNNYIIRLINALDERLTAVENDLATMSRVKFLNLVYDETEQEYTLEDKDGNTIDFASLSEMVEFPHLVIVRGTVNGEETDFYLRESDPDDASGVFEFYAAALVNNVVHEITVTMLPDDSVNVATHIQTIPTYTPGNGIDITNNVISADTTVLQEKLVAGSGISIDPTTHEIVNTAQGIDLWGWKGAGNFANKFNYINNVASGVGSTAEGDSTVASGAGSHAEGRETLASGSNSHAEGYNSIAGGQSSHAEGNGKAYATYSHAEGSARVGNQGDQSTGYGAHAEGFNCIARGNYSHVEGHENQTGHPYTHVQGHGNKTGHEYQTIFGTFNEVLTNSDVLEICGNGTDDSTRSNARILRDNGDEWLAGQIQPENGIRLKDANGVYYNIGIDTNGQLTISQV